MTTPNYTDACLDTWEPVYACPLPTGAEAVTGAALEAAVNLLWSLSGRQFGLCTKLLRPCRRECYTAPWPSYGYGAWGGTVGGYGWPFPALVAGEWINLACGACGEGCSCSTLSEAILPGPIYDVTEVKVDGVVLTPVDDYRVDNFRRLVRLGGETWPICNDLNLDDDQDGTWSVTIRIGKPLPQLGKLALGVLVTEFVKLILCDDTCALPRQVQSVSRQGVNMEFISPDGSFGIDQIGLYLPDLFINTYNPNRLMSRAKIYNVDDWNDRLVDTPPV